MLKELDLENNQLRLMFLENNKAYEKQKIVESLEMVGDLVELDYGGEKLE